MARIISVSLLVAVSFLVISHFYHEGNPKAEQNETLPVTQTVYSEPRKVVENYIRISAEGAWEAAMFYLTGEALDRVNERYKIADRAEILSLRTSVLTENGGYAEVTADVAVNVKGVPGRKNYLFRLRNLNGKWKIFDQQVIPFAYGPEKGTLSAEKEEVVRRYLDLSVAGKWEEASRYLTGTRIDVKKVETGLKIRDVSLEQLGEKDGRCLIEARYVLAGKTSGRPMRVLFEVVEAGGEYRISQAFKVEG